MKRQKLLFGLILLFLFSCSRNNINTSYSISSSFNLDTSSDNSSSSINSMFESENNESSSFTSKSSNNSSNEEVNSSSQEHVSFYTINKVREMSYALQNMTNEYDVAVSTKQVSITGVLLNRVDVVTTKKGYGDRYKLFIADETSYIYIQVNYATYAKLENSIGKAFSFTGNVALYCNEPEIILSSYNEISTNIDIDFEALSQHYDSINNIFKEEEKMHTNCKGIGSSSLISIDAKYIGIHDEKVLLFTDGVNIILLHTRDKVKNLLTLNSSYRLYATLNMYYYRPGLDYISHIKINDLDTSNLQENAKEITSSNLYSTKIYDKDNEKSNLFYPEYTSLYYSLYHFKGYLDYYVMNGKIYVVVTDNLINHNLEWTRENAKANKALFIVNDNYYNLTQSQFINSSYYSDYANNVQIDIYFSLDLYNTNNYYQIYLYEN